MDIRLFADEMEKKLKANDHKLGWLGEDVEWLFIRLKEEVKELGYILKKSGAMECNYPNCRDIPNIISEAADVANFAMMIADRITVGRKDE